MWQLRYVVTSDNSTPRQSSSGLDAHAKFEVAQPISSRLIAFYGTVDTLRYVVTGTFDPLTLTFELWP